MKIRIPANVEMADRILGGLTARQLAILAVHAVAIWGIWLAVAGHLPAYLFGAVAAPIGAFGVMWAMAPVEGTTLERLFAAALRHASRPRRRVIAPEGIQAMPSWWRPRTPPIAELDSSAHSITDNGAVTLGDDGAAIICRASSLNFALRSEHEQRALVEGFGRLLNALDAPTQFVVRSERVDLRAFIETLEKHAGALPHPALEAAAREHAAFLRSLGGRRDALSRQVLICFREPDGADESAWGLGHRVEEAGALLRGIGVRLVRQEGAEIADLLASAADSGGEPPHQGTGAPSGVVEGTW